MRITQISNTTNFNGIKNIGYARVINKEERSSRCAMNMELTNDEKGNDLDNYRNFLYQHPQFINRISPRTINIEIATQQTEIGTMLVASINGNPVSLNKENKHIIQYAQSLTEQIDKTKEKDFVVDPDYHLEPGVEQNIIYQEHIDDYMDGYSGELDILSKTGAIEIFDLYLNTIPSAAKEYTPENELEEEALDEQLNEIDEQTMQAMDDVISILYEPAYVKYNTMFFNAMLKSYKELYDPQNLLN